MIVANPPMIFSASILDTVSSEMVSAHTSIVLLSLIKITFVRTMCLGIFYCVFQALYKHNVVTCTKELEYTPCTTINSLCLIKDHIQPLCTLKIFEVSYNL